MKFSCKQCTSICCNNPPQLSGVDEVKRALSLLLDIQLFAVQRKKTNEFFVGVAQKDGVCPFKGKDSCIIYDQRFTACKEFNCSGIDSASVNRLSRLGDMDMLRVLTTNTENLSKPNTISKGELDDLNIKVVSVEEAIGLSSIFDFDKIMSDVDELKLKLGTNNDN